jgi:hypothetical protein
MTSNSPDLTAFSHGDNVVVARGTYPGTPGVFERLTADPKWAEITERNGSIRHHPVEWLDRVREPLPGSVN